MRFSLGVTGHPRSKRTKGSTPRARNMLLWQARSAPIKEINNEALSPTSFRPKSETTCLYRDKLSARHNLLTILCPTALRVSGFPGLLTE